MELSAIALGGLDRAQAALERTASRLARAAAPASDSAPVDTVDLATEVAGLLAARRDASINIKVLQTVEQIERRAIDILA